MSPPLVEFRNVGMVFGSHVVFSGISFTISEGENVVVLGPSGTGKSVLLKLIVGLLKPTSGIVAIKGKDIATMKGEELLQVSRDVGMLFQGAALLDSLTVFENIAFPLREHHLGTEDEIIRIVESKLDIVGLVDAEQKFPAELSGGMEKRVGLARALATSPHVMLFDEPTTGLDPTTRSLISDIIIQLRDTHGITSIVVTHDMECAHRIANRVLFVADGRIQVDGALEQLWDTDQKVRDFVSGHWHPQ